ncbi:hypothetical protein [Nocardioides okcheonensis]|uniref:hypothetical protein n=1 Tax=Nocardioides okcheonensis TaxID=2894081 RepID=UPI001E5B339E|nr:hypothetical protein [Nocardioides okcheonensis]UFN43875.1 hypothetical protein LN652_17780 [Nocardioides okcheonensis]
MARAIAARTGSSSTPAAISPARARHQVAADPAAEVDDAAARDRGRQPCGPVRRDPRPGRLLERVGGEEHQACGLAQLGHPPLAQLGLGRRGRGPLGVRLDAAHGAGDPDGIARVLGPRLRGDLQQPGAVGGAQPRQRLELHARILSGGADVGRVGNGLC